jgi:hypothetical protein
MVAVGLGIGVAEGAAARVCDTCAKTVAATCADSGRWACSLAVLNHGHQADQIRNANY